MLPQVCPVILPLGCCILLVRYCAPFIRIYNLSQVILKYMISISHSKYQSQDWGSDFGPGVRSLGFLGPESEY